MSLQTRIVVLVAGVLLVSVALGSVFAGVQARRALEAEIRAAMLGGAHTVQSAYEDLPRSDHPARDLAQLVSTFDGNRHVQARLQDGAGRIERISTAAPAGAPSPRWFQRLIAPPTTQTALAAPPTAAGAQMILLRATPGPDISALWVELSGVASVLGGSALAGLVLVVLVVRAALAPLRELSTSLGEIGRGDYRGRMRERGPKEILRLERSFNAMAERLSAMGRRNWALEQQLLTLQDEERAEIARDLHDDVGPLLFAVSLDAEVITQQLAAGRPDGVPDQVAAIQAGVRHVQREIRAMVARLRPTPVTELGLGRAIQDLVKFWADRRPEIAFDLRLPESEAHLRDALKDTAFRVIQEAVNNAVRHAHPDRIEIAIRCNASAVEVEVTNNGAAPEPAEPAALGFGLVGMRERVASSGGSLAIRRPGAETATWSVAAVLPLAPELGRAGEAA
jgi:two-component system, NarL family, sensor histidine kinase UhpB